MGISRDITERKKMENELIKAKKNAEQSDKLKSAFLANMSHEIRTPLNGILGFTNIILEKDQLTVSEKMKYGSIIQKSSEGLLQVINDILDISRIESGDLQIELSACEINRTLSSLHIMFQSKINDLNKDIRLNVKVGDDIVIETDEKRLRQVFNNLLDNAIKFTTKGEINFGIKQIKNNKISFFVYDTGIGIPLEMQKIVFDRFRQIDSSLLPESGGNGLGLSIVKNIIELLGGRIWIDPLYKNGALFRFEIPYSPVKTPPVKLKAVKNFSDTALNADSRLNILLVEDDPVNQQYVKEILKEKNCNIYIATHSQEAFNFVELYTIDIILMDIRLPGISGLEITKQIRKYNHDVYIIAQTAYAMQSDEKRAIMAGCNDYIAKPILSDLLFEKINKGLKKKYGYT
jgi:CheY-like chemotaxis protein/nitrogen-specific signal transduction histidine kinase